MRNYKNIVAWKRADELTIEIYRITRNFPKEEIYGLTSQLRRAAISIAANIVEGFKKTGPADKIRYLNISQGSLEECRYYLILSNDLNYGNTDVLAKQIDEVARLLAAYSNAVRKNN